MRVMPIYPLVHRSAQGIYGICQFEKPGTVLLFPVTEGYIIPNVIDLFSILRKDNKSRSRHFLNEISWAQHYSTDYRIVHAMSKTGMRLRGTVPTAAPPVIV